jgi:hypothetical protein
MIRALSRTLHVPHVLPPYLFICHRLVYLKKTEGVHMITPRNKSDSLSFLCIHRWQT